ncbi:MAG: Rrf2 family transcriptional regulator [Clostridia bacterium]|nr:Rrf2 family transcriptional regulator [Clostridia bacterium]MBO4884442.1 Rrf2 family transcriptional regulator [Clostridia bacterium]MBR4443873.1 Rrf2 family transcriptional regulator [Clostridia bacterium]
MKISTRGRYALRMMIDAAQNQKNGYVALKDIALRQGISKKYLEQIALQLMQAGMLRASRGHQGGYALASSPAEYTVGQILRVTEGTLAPVACLDHEPNVCERRGFCLTLPVWEGLQAVVDRYLDGITLQDVLDGKTGGQTP